MKSDVSSYPLLIALCATLMIVCIGCSKEEAAETVKKAEESAEGAAKTVAEGTEEVVKEGEKLAGELGEKALAYLAPLKEQFGSLDKLKETPAELKAAVTKLIDTIEGKAEGLNLPEAVSTTLATAKEKLVALRDYLDGEVEQAKVNEHVKGIMDAVKSGLGMGDE